MENSLVDSGETTEMNTTEKTEETVKVILREVKSQDIPETVAPANKGTVSGAEDERFMYKFSETKNVTVDKYKGKAFLSIGKKNFHQGNVKFRGIHFPIKQWSVLKNNFAAIDEALKHFQSRNNRTKIGNTCEALDKSSCSIETSLFDGRSYLSWASQMELFLKQLNLAYVLTETYPATGSVSSQDWLRDDSLCHNHLMKSLSDDLYQQYLKKFKHAKELWDELKWVYHLEESNSKLSQVKNYIEFKMVEERPILEQVQDFNKIADSIVGAGMLLDEKFHVSTIISKLPSSWRGFVTSLMEEEFLPVSMLMERVKDTEEFLKNGEQSQTTGSSQMERRPSLAGTTHTGLKRKETERDIIIGDLAMNCWGKESDERASKKPNQMTSSVPEYVASETQARTNNE